MKFIFIFVFFNICFINLFKVVKIVRTIVINAFMYNKVLPVFLLYKGMVAVRTFESDVLGKTSVRIRTKMRLTDLA